MADQVEEVKAKTDIVSIIGEHVKLTKSGKNYKGLCPFHAEKTPSFMVTPDLQIFKCFGCGEGGDVFAFLEKYEKMDFGEALHFLADRAGIKLTSFNPSEVSEKDKLYELNELAAKFYHFLLTNHPIGKVALNYIKEERKITDASIATFNIGFAPANRNVLSEYLIKKKNAKPDDLVKAGLVYPTRGKVFDRFDGRIIFPISNHRGRVTALAGRILPPGKTGIGKYINSPETAIYHKSQSLYGLDITKDFIKKESKAIVVEGELDLISSYQAGVKNVVAIKGSAVTAEQTSLLSRFASTVILALDTDFAGIEAARRGISILENAGVEIRVAKMERFKDPDEAAKADPAFYKKTIDNAIPVWDFIIDSVVQKFDITTGVGKGKISRELSPILANIEDKIVQAHYVKKLAKMLEVDESAVEDEVEKEAVGAEHRGTESGERSRTIEKTSSKSRRLLLEERLIGIIFITDKKLLNDSKIKELIHDQFLKKIIETRGEDLPQELKVHLADIVLKNSLEEVSKEEMPGIIKELEMIDIKEKMTLLSKDIKKREAKLEYAKLSQKLEAISKS